MTDAYPDPPSPLTGSAEDTTAPPRRHSTSRKGKDKRAWFRLARRVLLSLAAVGMLAGLVYAFRPQPVLVDIESVSIGRLAVEVRETGQTQVKDRYLISTPSAGDLSRVELEVNDSVTEGQPVAHLAPVPPALLDDRSRAEAEARLAAARAAQRQAESQVSHAQAAEELAQRELMRTRGAQAAIPAQQVEHAEFQVRLRNDELASAQFATKVAREQARLALATLSHRRGRDVEALPVPAPVSGQVLRVHRRSAGILPPGTALLEVGDLAGLEIVADLLTTDAVRVKPGALVEVEDWGGEGALKARVRKVELAGFTRPSALGVEEQRTNVLMVLESPREQWRQLGDAFRVEVRFVLWEDDRALMVPGGALFRRGEGWVAFRVEDGVARIVDVEIGHRGATSVQVLSGLTEGDLVVVDPGDHVDDGVRVAAR